MIKRLSLLALLCATCSIMPMDKTIPAPYDGSWRDIKKQGDVSVFAPDDYHWLFAVAQVLNASPNAQKFRDIIFTVEEMPLVLVAPTFLSCVNGTLVEAQTVNLTDENLQDAGLQLRDLTWKEQIKVVPLTKIQTKDGKLANPVLMVPGLSWADIAQLGLATAKRRQSDLIEYAKKVGTIANEKDEEKNGNLE